MELVKLRTVIWKEEDMYVIKEAFTGVTTQGRTVDEAVGNLKEAWELYFDEMPEMKGELEKVRTIGAISVEVTWAFQE